MYFPNKKKDKEGEEKKKNKVHKEEEWTSLSCEWDSDASFTLMMMMARPSKCFTTLLSTIKEAPLLFSPCCLVVKASTRVSNDNDSDNDDELSYDDLVQILHEVDDYIHKEKKRSLRP